MEWSATIIDRRMERDEVVVLVRFEKDGGYVYEEFRGTQLNADELNRRIADKVQRLELAESSFADLELNGPPLADLT